MTTPTAPADDITLPAHREPGHPEPHTLMWTTLEAKAIQRHAEAYARAAVELDRQRGDEKRHFICVCPDCADRASPSRAAVQPGAMEAAARWVEARCEAYANEHGSTDPETGTTEYPGDGAEYVGELMEIAEGLRALAPSPPPRVDDLSTLVSRLARSLRQAAPDNDLSAKAVDYLRRHGLTGSPLRGVATVTAAVDVGAAAPKGGQDEFDAWRQS